MMMKMNASITRYEVEALKRNGAPKRKDGSQLLS